MKKILMIAAVSYFIIVSIYSAAMTVSDKKAAKKGRERVPEKKLFAASFLGGSLAMYITMKLIRHKTKHKRFMIGIPAIMIFQICLILLIYFFAAA